MKKYITYLWLLVGGVICLAAGGCVQPQFGQEVQDESSDSLFDLLDEEVLFDEPTADSENGSVEDLLLTNPAAPESQAGQRRNAPKTSAIEFVTPEDPPEPMELPDTLESPEPLALPNALEAPPAVESGAMASVKDINDRGLEAFNSNCTQCHDAEEALAVKKTYEEWIETINEMVEYAVEDDLEIQANDVAPIASYLSKRTDAEIAAAKAEAEKKSEEADDEVDDQTSERATAPLRGGGQPDFGAELEKGKQAFNASCLDCHDASRSLTVDRSFADWMSTVSRMAKKKDANIPAKDFGRISWYLSSRTTKEIEAARAEAEKKKDDDKPEEEDAGNSQSQTELIKKGETAFYSSCIECHDAERSLSVQQSFGEWMSTIRRMAEKDDAEIDSRDFRAIATFLSKRTSADIEQSKAKAKQKEDEQEKQDDASSSKSKSELASQGETAFYASCIKCHDAERSLSVQQSFSEWMSTIRRMAEKEDAEIKQSDFRAIATFLSERSDEEVKESQAKKKDGDDDESDGKSDEPDTGKKFDPALVASGRTAFNKSCLKCHNAQRSLSKKKSLSSWRATVKRMAAKDGADVRPSDIEAISVYLASESAGGGAVEDGGGEVSPWTFSSTLSTQHRVSSDPIENPGFFVDAWVGADWQSDGPLRATVMACTSCHSDRNSSKGFTFELVEASATLDLKKLLFERHHSPATKQAVSEAMQSSSHGGNMLQLNSPANGMQNAAGAMGTQTSLAVNESPISTSADLKMGRFVVPFGAFAAFSHPGSYKTVSNPLMFNMGRRLDTGGSFQPVLPAPYSDEGLNLRFGLREFCDRSYTLDLFAVNGLQGTAAGTNFNLSRSYTDNNRSPAVGGRYTLGNQIFRLGASGMLGQLQNDGSDEFDYHLLGADAVVTTELLRAYFEYAFRREETGMGNNDIDGYIIELELKLLERLSFLTRYDTLEHELASGTGQSIDRFTWGLNLTFERAGLLLLNHEHWMLDDRSDIDVIGLRWVTTF